MTGHNGKRRKVTDEERQTMKKLFLKGFLSAPIIGHLLGYTAQTVLVNLRKMGINTGRKKVDCVCETCGAEFERHRSEARMREHHFCSPECYARFMEKPSTHKEAMRQKVARDKINNFLPYDRSSGSGIYIVSDDEIYVFPSRETMLLWKRTGLSYKAFNTKTMQYEYVTHKEVKHVG